MSESQPATAGAHGRAARRGPRQRALRFLGRHRRRLGRLTLALPVLGVAAVDFGLRGSRIWNLPGRYFFSYATAMAESGLLWGTLLCVAAARRGVVRWIAATLFVLMATIAVGIQIYFHRQYSVYLNLQATLFGTSVAESVFGQLSADAKNFAWSLLPVFAGAIALVWLAQRLVRPRRRLRRVATMLSPVFVASVFFIPCSYAAMQGSTPDVIYFHAIGGLMKQLSSGNGLDKASVRPGLRHPPPLAPLRAAPPVPRNVLFILTESVRHDDACSSPTLDCRGTPFTNRLLPDRIGLEQMRSNSTTTAIQLAVLWTGLEPTAGRQPLHDAPSLFEFASAAGIHTAYWTSHHMMFANSRLWVRDLPVERHASATTLDPQANIDLGASDELLTARVAEELPGLGEPFFAIAHYGNTHVPYRVDPDGSPFQPSVESKSPEDNAAYHNFYRNAVYLQDRTIADLVDRVRRSAFGPRTLVFYTSDHGEQFREHEQLGHTQSLYDEELHVPAWIDAPLGALTAEERARIEALRQTPLFHSDLTPTVLDWLGLHDAPELAVYREKMVGTSWLRPRRPDAEQPLLHISNCSGVWGCAFENWGVIRGLSKLIAREWEADWQCFDLARDPLEKQPLDLSLPGCSELRDEAERFYGGLPGSH